MLPLLLISKISLIQLVHFHLRPILLGTSLKTTMIILTISSLYTVDPDFDLLMTKSVGTSHQNISSHFFSTLHTIYHIFIDMFY